jgi:tRNA(fMet)-specific endonuclease VapC
MTRFLLDTNVLSDLLKKSPEPKVIQRLQQLTDAEVATSVVCVMELRFGAARVGNRKALWKRIKEEILSRITILPLRTSEAIRAGELLADLEKRGQIVGIEDVLIAATALSNNLTVSTRNVEHFSRIKGLRVQNWWS